MFDYTINNVHLSELVFRKAIEADIAEIMSMYHDVIQYMNEQRLYQWDDAYPCKNDILQDIKNGEMTLVTVNGVIAAAFTVNKKCDTEYIKGQWAYSGTDYCVIHRFCVNPLFQNRKIGTVTMRNVEEVVADNGIKAKRLDCFIQNIYALKMYKALGFSIVGMVTWRKGDFYLMEKVLC